jgi:hypothetical protein
MPISIACPACSKSVLLPEQMSGTALRCPHCQQAVELPSAEMADNPSGDWETARSAIAAEVETMPVLGILLITGLVLMVGTSLYLLFVADMAEYFGDKPLGRQFTRIVIMVSLCCVAGVVAVAISVLIVMTTNTDFYTPEIIRARGIIQGLILAAYLLGVVFQLHFVNLVQRLLRQHMMR